MFNQNSIIKNLIRVKNKNVYIFISKYIYIYKLSGFEEICH